MLSSIPDDSLLLIRCPSCGQRFKVGEDLRERTVECGSCEHRFRISDEVIVRGRKFYPSEQKSIAPNRFHRIPLSGGEILTGSQVSRYGAQPDPAVLDPVSPQKIIAGVIGVTAMILLAMLLMFGGSRGGVLDGMIATNRILLAGFGSLLGGGLLIYANPRTRLKASALSLLLGGSLLAVPFFFTAGSESTQNQGGLSQEGSLTPAHDSKHLPTPDSAIETLRNRIGTGPLVAEIARLAKEGSRDQAVGLWFRDLSDSRRFLVMDYILRVIHADSSSHFYPRDNGDYLLVATGSRQSLQEIANLTEPLGQIVGIYPEISVIEIRLRNEIFVEEPIEKLSNKLDPGFYDSNKRELGSIDLDRVKRAVKRLAEVEPKLYRSDISRKLISLLGENSVRFKGNICSALAVWSEQPGPASDAALSVVEKLIAKKEEVPSDVVALIVKEKNLGILTILDELWFENPMTWESLYADLGQPIEPRVIARLPDSKGIIRYSAVRILGQVGSDASLPVLAAAAVGADSELKVLLNQAEKSIRKRLGQ